MENLMTVKELILALLEEDLNATVWLLRGRNKNTSSLLLYKTMLTNSALPVSVIPLTDLNGTTAAWAKRLVG